MKKNGIYFNKKQEETPSAEPRDTRRFFRILLIYVIITLGAVVIFMFVNARGSEYLTAFLLAMFIMVTCAEVYLSNPEKESFSVLKRFLNKR